MTTRKSTARDPHGHDQAALYRNGDRHRRAQRLHRVERRRGEGQSLGSEGNGRPGQAGHCDARAPLRIRLRSLLRPCGRPPSSAATERPPLSAPHPARHQPPTPRAPPWPLVPGQVSLNLPAGVAATIAYGDLVSAIAALVAIIFLKFRWQGALAVVWAFNLIGIADLLVSTGAAINAKMYQVPIGFNWYIVNFYVPALIVSHAMMVYRLVPN